MRAWAILSFLALCANAVVPPASSRPDHSARIREEGLKRSQAIDVAQSLSDGIGARLTGSPNMRRAYAWSMVRLRAAGATNVHLEDAGEFGLSWRQNNSWLRMTVPDTMVMIAQAAHWSVSSNGSKSGEAVAVEIASPADFDRYRGKLRGKIVLLGPLRPTPQVDTPLFRRWSDEDLRSGKAAEPQRLYHRNVTERQAARERDAELGSRIAAFLHAEGILAVVQPSPETTIGNGSTGLIQYGSSSLTRKGWTSDTRVPFPQLVTTIESFGRAWRLSKAGTPVSLQFDVDTETFGEREHGYNVVAEIAGTDPRLKSQVVMLGAHLDSWGTATGAADNAAGVAASIEVVRILNAIGARPRRTIRVVLFCGEEQGGFMGSRGYVTRHFGFARSGGLARSADIVPPNDLVRLPGYETLSAYYNIDHGSGRIRGVFAGGNPAMGAVFAEWIRPLADLGVTAVFPHRYYPADQSSFERVGLPGVSFLQDGLDYDTRAHHSNLDSFDHLVGDDLAQVATVMAIFVMNTADRDELIPHGPAAR